MILIEISTVQRDLMIQAAHSRMNVLSCVHNGWLLPEYAELESLVYQLTTNAAE